jgi:hypothetical protein
MTGVRSAPYKRGVTGSNSVAPTRSEVVFRNLVLVAVSNRGAKGPGGYTLTAERVSPGRPLTEPDLRYLHQTHGLPPELVTELLD